MDSGFNGVRFFERDINMNTTQRMLPPMEPDNGWWWEQASKGVLAIQRCSSCQTLRHPPKPMCNQCQSLEWDFVESTGRGTVSSYTVLHHPQFPGYKYPINIVLVDLEEGQRITSELVNADADNIEFGMSVQVAFNTDPDGFVLPVFTPMKELG